MKIALVGIGKIARDQHVPALAGSDVWELAATVSRQGTVEGVPGFDDFGLMLETQPDIRTVSLCLPPVPRFAYAQAALRAGRHVMLEKPPGAVLAEVQALADLAEEKRLSLFASWHSREARMVDLAQTWLADKRVMSAHIDWREDVRQWHPGQEWVFEPGGMGVFDPGINALSILTKILPMSVHLRSATLDVPENRQTPIAADLVFSHNVSCTLDWRKTGTQVWEIAVETDAGVLRLSQGGAVMHVNDTLIEPPDDVLVGEYPRLYARFARLIADGQSDVDLSPMIHVADAFTLGARRMVAPFAF